MFTRRAFLRLVGGTFLAGAATAVYAVAVEPVWRLRIAEYALRPASWPGDLTLRIVALADFHLCVPWMTAGRLTGIVERANRLQPDVIVLLGDYLSSMSLSLGAVPIADWSEALSRLSAPLGVHAILGNHDWWEDRDAQAAGGGETFVHRVLRDAGIAVYANRAARLEKAGVGFWLAGLEDQLALKPSAAHGRVGFVGLDDLPGTLAQVTDDRPVILLAHEPDIFPRVPDRVALTLSGHTHGGQVRLFGYSPVVPSAYGNRYAYGHVREQGRDIVVSGGLGCSIAPIRLGSPPEITVVDLG